MKILQKVYQLCLKLMLKVRWTLKSIIQIRFWFLSGWEWGILFSPFHSEKRLASKSQIQLAFTWLLRRQGCYGFESTYYIHIFQNPLLFRRGFFKIYGWSGRIRTYGWGIQSPLPYHLATLQCYWVGLYGKGMILQIYFSDDWQCFLSISRITLLSICNIVVWIGSLQKRWLK